MVQGGYNIFQGGDSVEGQLGRALGVCQCLSKGTSSPSEPVVACSASSESGQGEGTHQWDTARVCPKSSRNVAPTQFQGI